MNSIFRWCISRCAALWDAEQQPKWLRSAIDRDTVLKQHDRKLASIDKRLSRDAAEWRVIESTKSERCSGVVAPPPSTPRARTTTAQRGLLAVSLVTVASLLLFVATRPSAPIADKPEAPPNPTVADQQRVRAELNALVHAYTGSIKDIESSVNDFSNRTQRSLSFSDISTIRKNVRQPFESFSRAYGKALVVLSRPELEEPI